MPLFLFIFHIFITYIHSLYSFIQYIYQSPYAGASLHLLIAWKLSGKALPVVPSRESNSGLPYSKPTRYQLSHAAPYWATPHHKWATPHHKWATPHHTEPRRTIMSWTWKEVEDSACWGLANIRFGNKRKSCQIIKGIYQWEKRRVDSGIIR